MWTEVATLSNVGVLSRAEEAKNQDGRVRSRRRAKPPLRARTTEAKRQVERIITHLQTILPLDFSGGMTSFFNSKVTQLILNFKQNHIKRP